MSGPRNPSKTSHQLMNPFADGGVYTRFGCPLRSVESGTQLHLIPRPDMESLHFLACLNFIKMALLTGLPFQRAAR
jgi:hypothetical protein